MSESWKARGVQVEVMDGHSLSLEAEDLAPYTQAAQEVLTRKHDAALAEAMVAAWGSKLESEGCRARAGEQACSGVLRLLRRYDVHADTSEST